jgi:hypothetical protein
LPPPCLSRPLLLFACGGLLALGCEIRDEEARSGPAAEWLEATARRLADGTPAAVTAASPSSRLECIDGFAAGSRKAAAGGLPMLLVFRATWCRWSSDLLDTVLANEAFAAATGRVVCVAIDADREAAVCRSFGVQIFPTVIVLDPDRRERFRGSGRAAQRGLDLALQAALAPPGKRVAVFPESTPR